MDLVLALKRSDTARIGELFPLEEFYCPPEEIIVQEVLRAQRGHFNLIHHESGFKADVFLANRDPFHRWALSERRLVEVDGEPVHVAPLEYVIVRKLEFYREGGSEKHLRDIEATWFSRVSLSKACNPKSYTRTLRYPGILLFALRSGHYVVTQNLGFGALVQIDSPGIQHGVVGLVAVDAGRAAGFPGCPIARVWPSRLRLKFAPNSSA